ncbi:hypothetical protein COV19_02635 [Candidatus Woesearchaeota archaeon CG10_big_fil_rev_8_21_14_0_10_44_13]|nr:MAG: hypothetical protein COV19_02635 [Candidatus Woesearchaeota archaeon CG10_big_fil_rev_8_21_14_0_10_44_13]
MHRKDLGEKPLKPRKQAFRGSKWTGNIGLIGALKPPFNSRIGKATYQMELYLNKERFKERIGEITRKGVLPVLVWFYKEER